MTCEVQVFVTPPPATDVIVNPFGVSSAEVAAVLPAIIREALESITPTPVALVTATVATVASWLVDTYGSRTGELIATKTDGTRVSRRLTITHNGTASADATVATVSSHGHGSSADLDPATPWLDVDVSGTGAAQVVRIRVTAAANGASWTATFYPDFLRTP